MAFRDSTTNSGQGPTVPSVAVPAGVQIGDIVILVVSIDAAVAVVDPGDWPTGFTELHEVDLTIDGHTSAVGWKRLSAADAGTYTFGDVNAPTNDWICQAFAFSGRHATDPPTSTANSSDAANASPVSVNASTITALTGDDLLWISSIDIHINNLDGAGHTPPASYTEAEDDERSWCNVSGAYRENVSAGATGTVTGTFTMVAGAATAGWTAYLVRMPIADVSDPTIKLNHRAMRPAPFKPGRGR